MGDDIQNYLSTVMFRGTPCIYLYDMLRVDLNIVFNLWNNLNLCVFSEHSESRQLFCKCQESGIIWKLAPGIARGILKPIEK